MAVEFLTTYDQSSVRKVKDHGILQDFRSDFQMEKQMTVKFSKTFDRNSSGKRK